jgi:hypothetical protein
LGMGSSAYKNMYVQPTVFIDSILFLVNILGFMHVFL